MHAAPDPVRDFNGCVVVTFENRRGREMATLIERYGGRPLVAPALQEVPLESNGPVLAFAADLVARRVDALVLLTGVGFRALWEAMTASHPEEVLLAALRRIPIAARGPKPVAVLREIGLAAAVTAPEPNTWVELISAITAAGDRFPLSGRRVAIQEYGASNSDLLAALRERGANVTSIPVYRWALPDDTGPLAAAIRVIAAAEAGAVLFTNAVQVRHLRQVAAGLSLADDLRTGLARTVIGSVGPTTTEALRAAGLSIDVEPAHPKMGHLVKETAAQMSALLAAKRQGIS